jgi:hypothetical protein
MKKFRRWYAGIALAGVFCLLGLGSQGYTASQVSSKSAKATFDFKRYTGNKPFKLNTLPTTPYGPPWANILVEKENFLECRGASIALCYYSGPGPTTPCVPDGRGLANCTCYQIPSGEPYFVDINAILNLDVYLETVAKCGKNGNKCRPTGTIEAPVCKNVNNNTLIPGADLISAFSLYLEKQIPVDPTTCSTPSAYAGCMTAPCKQTGKKDPTTGLPLVQCGCPTFTGPYQVGQQVAQDQCVLGSNNVWSAAYTPPASPTPTPTPGAGF